MVVDISELLNKNGSSKEFSLTESIAEINLLPEVTAFIEPVSVKGTVTNNGRSFSVSGLGHTKVTMPCDRCIKAVEVDLDFEIDEAFTPSGNNNNEEETYSGSDIDLSSAVKKSMIMNLPMKVLCKEDCKGLCPQCGKDLNTGECGCKTEYIDPRFESLRSLFNVNKEV